MIASLTLAFLVTLSGAIATYLFDEKASPAVRLCTGACLGLPVLGLIGFVIASFIGLTYVTVLLSAAICAAPLFIMADDRLRNSVNHDWTSQKKAIRRFFLHPEAGSLGYVFFYLGITIVLWQVFSRAMIEDESKISTGLLNNFGDLPFHLSVITGFAFGNNFPPEDPTYAGVRFTYPFISDFVSAIFVKCGADLRQSLFIENIILAVSFVGLVHRWALVLLRDRLAAVITPLIVLLNGGFGWVLIFNKAMTHPQGLWGSLYELPPSLTVIPETTWRWGNAISALLVPQRGFLMGLPIAVIVFTQWWLADENDTEEPGPENAAPRSRKRREDGRHGQIAGSRFPVSTRRMIAAGIAAGLLPLVHAHSFVVVMAMGACLALLRQRWRDWIAFFVATSLIALPQLWWSTSNTMVSASSFFAWEVGWDHGEENPVWFWIKNTGLFIPLVLTAIIMRGEGYSSRKRLLLFYLPFTLCFIVPNFLKMAPWIWDNIKVLFYWWLASAPLVALLLARLWRQGPVRQLIAVVLFVSVILAGAIEVAGIVLRSTKYDIFDAEAIRFSEILKQQTPPRSLILHAPVHNHPVFLSGRRSLMGYPGHIWTHGLEFVQREREVKNIYSGGPNAEPLLQHYNIEYVVVGPLEQLIMPVNDQFFSRYQKVGDIGEYTLYKIR
ncbi:MAG TPA: hypothetical protein VF074_21730 [Pyrinomonadaceae bacterium]